MRTPYRTCRACGEKDVTVSWRGENLALLCVSCHSDGAKPQRTGRRPLSLDQHRDGLVRLSPAALRAAMA